MKPFTTIGVVIFALVGLLHLLRLCLGWVVTLPEQIIIGSLHDAVELRDESRVPLMNREWLEHLPFCCSGSFAGFSMFPVMPVAIRNREVL